MAHYAFMDENNIVTEVIVGIDETQTIDGIEPEIWYGNFRQQLCKRTSYNKKIRFNFAGIGFKYDVDLDAFIPPQPFISWTLDQNDCNWKSPKPYPNDGATYRWNENIKDWEIYG